MLRLSRVEAHYGNVRALRDISFEVLGGSITTLIGANGAGKTTSVRVISGLTAATQGTIEFNGKRIDRMRPEQIVRLGISFVPQGRLLFPALTVAENLELGAYLRGDHAEVRRDLDKAYQQFPILAEKRRQQACMLSGGQQQVVAIARGLMSRPRLLMLDEPSLGLAPLVVEEIFAIIRRVRDDGVAVLLVEQNANMALRIADYGYVLESGATLTAGTARSLTDNVLVRQAYMGQGTAAPLGQPAAQADRGSRLDISPGSAVGAEA